MLHGVSNQLDSRDRRDGLFTANRSAGNFAGNSTGNSTGNSVENSTDETDWSPTTNIAIATTTTTTTTKRKTKWVFQEVIDEKKQKEFVFGVASLATRWEIVIFSPLSDRCRLLPLLPPAPPRFRKRPLKKSIRKKNSFPFKSQPKVKAFSKIG